LKICLISDTHLNITTSKQIKLMMKDIIKEDFDLLVHAGDYCGGQTGNKSVTPTIKIIRDLYAGPFLTTIGNHDCISEDTEILTLDGWKSYSSIKETDFAATMNAERNLEWQQVESIVKRETRSDESLYVSSKRISMSVTENHRMYLYRRHTKKIEVVLAKDLPRDFSIVTAIGSKTSINLSDIQIKLAAWLCTDSHFGPYDNITLYQRLSNSDHVHDILKDNNVTYKTETRARDTKEICGKRLVKAPEPGCEFRISSQESRRISAELGVFSNKCLPSWYREMSDAQWDIFLKELIDADGTVTRGKALVFYGKKEICEDVQIGCTLHNWSASITEYRKGHYRVNISKRNTVRVTDIKKTPAPENTKVWCISVPNGNFICRKDNKVHVTGNCWLRPSKNPKFPITVLDHEDNYNKIVETFKINNVHFIDEDGLYTHPDFPLIKFMGVSGWYQNQRPPTNDHNFLPKAYPSFHDILRHRAHDLLGKQINALDLIYDKDMDTVVFVSHFPVIRVEGDRRGFDDFCWSEALGEVIQKEYNCKMFLNGHAHMNYSGPLRWECGSDYYNPKYKIIKI